MPTKQSLQMVLPLEQLPAFSLLLQQGVWIEAQTGCSVANLLTEQFGIDENYIIERITTLFLDFKPVDDLKTTYVNDGSTLALSSAMPGLVGTTMRRGSHLAAMRGDISCQMQKQVVKGPGIVKVKLFNLVMSELGATILAQGVRLKCRELDRFLRELDNGFWHSVQAASIGAQQLDPHNLVQQLNSFAPDDEILFKVEFGS